MGPFTRLFILGAIFVDEWARAAKQGHEYEPSAPLSDRGNLLFVLVFSVILTPLTALSFIIPFISHENYDFLLYIGAFLGLLLWALFTSVAESLKKQRIFVKCIFWTVIAILSASPFLIILFSAVYFSYIFSEPLSLYISSKHFILLIGSLITLGCCIGGYLKEIYDCNKSNTKTLQ